MKSAVCMIEITCMTCMIMNKEKGHLKDIPSAKEVEENGIFLGEMDAKLLQKIEELTLYTIQQEKKIEDQDEEIKKLKL